MVFISTNVPLEELKSKDDVFYKYDWFLLETRIQNKNMDYDDLLNSQYLTVALYPYWYNKPLYMYLMSNNYYYNSDLYKIMGNTCTLKQLKRMPEYYSEENAKKYPVLPKEHRVMIQQDILDGFVKFEENNFRKNPIVEVVIGNV